MYPSKPHIAEKKEKYFSCVLATRNDIRLTNYHKKIVLENILYFVLQLRQYIDPDNLH